MKSPYVSIILPIYKVEPYLERCLRSLKAQMFTDFEAILVDDGSPDSCGAICDAFAKEDARFIPVHQPNGGVGRARNAGLERATGRFIAYVDPDDYVSPEYLAHMIDAQKRHDADLVIARYVTLNERTMQKVWEVPMTEEGFLRREGFGQALSELYNLQRIGTLYAKLYKREILEGIRYSETVKMRGDVIFVTHVLERTGSIEIINFSDYFYIRYAAGSITKQVDPDLFQTHLEVNIALEESMERCGWMSEGMRDAIDKRLIDAAKLCVNSIRRGPWSLEEKGAYVDRILEHPEFRSALERRKARYPQKEVDLMRPGKGTEWVRRLDAAEGRMRPLRLLARPVMAFLLKLKQLIRR